MPCRSKIEKNCGIVARIGFEPMQRGFVAIPHTCSRRTPGLNETRLILVFLVFLSGLPTAGICSFLGFTYAIPGCGICFNRSVPKKSSPAASNLSMFLRA